MHTEGIKLIFNSTVKIVNFSRHAKHQLKILKRHQQKIYEKKIFFIASIILRWNTQVNLIESLMRSKIALKIYAKNAEAFVFVMKNLLDSNFWNDLKDFLIILKFIHDHQKNSESNTATIDKIFIRWIEICQHLIQCIAHNQHENAIWKFLKTSFNIKLNKQMQTMHRVVYYFHLLQVKTSLNQPRRAEIIDFMKQHISRNFWSKVENAFYDFRNQIKSFDVLNEAWINANDTLLFWKLLISNFQRFYSNVNRISRSTVFIWEH